MTPLCIILLYYHFFKFFEVENLNNIVKKVKKMIFGFKFTRNINFRVKCQLLFIDVNAPRLYIFNREAYLYFAQNKLAVGV